MAQLVPAPIERYLASLNRHHDPVIDAVAEQGRAEGLPIVDAEVGLLLHVLALSAGARRILEIGTAIGYSGIWLARALPPDGVLLSLEIDRAMAERARANFIRAGLADRANVVVGDAARMLHKVSGPFDLIFNDGDKRQYPALLDPLVEKLRLGGLLVTDNVLWDGEVVPGFTAVPTRALEQTLAIAEFNDRVAGDDRLRTTVLPLRDGVSVSVRVS